MNRALPLLTNPTHSRARSAELGSELQTHGMRWLDPRGPGLSRSGGAGPSDHKAVRLEGQTLMVPIFTHASAHSPFSARVSADGDTATLLRHGRAVATLSFPSMPRFYALSTADGIPYWKIATLHGSDVLATTVLQTCIRYGNRESACQFCAIGQSLAKKNTVAEKTPEQLAEVARAAVELDHVQHAVLTTGTPHTDDRGAAVLSAAARAIKGAVSLPIQAQCEPPADFVWFERMREAGVDSLGLHLEAVSERVRKRIMPGKAEVPVETYYRAFAQAVGVFGRAQVSTYILAGLGDSREEIASACQRLLELGVYPFVVPFVPISGTPLENHPAPSPAFLNDVLSDVARLIARHGMRSSDVRAGCARCGACSSLRAREVGHA
ncbi:MAG TPA: MSMEG_0568 family radical SAM protein [Polyangiaceae bacterium]|nr:MSMEG_0568 family radical SAM protein [Polyangiaceae bacterium]